MTAESILRGGYQRWVVAQHQAEREGAPLDIPKIIRAEAAFQANDEGLSMDLLIALSSHACLLFSQMSEDMDLSVPDNVIGVFGDAVLACQEAN